MYFVVFGTDRPGSGEVRAQNRPAHQVHLREHDHPVTVLHGGPTLTDDGEAMNGTMLVIEADNLEAVHAFLAADPYNKAGLFESVVVRPWRWGLGAPPA